MKKIPRFALSLPLFFLFAGCSLFESSDGGLPPDLYEGFYAFGWEINDFRPCANQDETWWVTGEAKAVERLRERYWASLEVEKGGLVYVRLRGKPSGIGNYDPLGGSDREFSLSEVAEVRAAESGDC